MCWNLQMGGGKNFRAPKIKGNMCIMQCSPKSFSEDFSFLCFLNFIGRPRSPCPALPPGHATGA